MDIPPTLIFLCLFHHVWDLFGHMPITYYLILATLLVGGLRANCHPSPMSIPPKTNPIESVR